MVESVNSNYKVRSLLRYYKQKEQRRGLIERQFEMLTINEIYRGSSLEDKQQEQAEIKEQRMEEINKDEGLSDDDKELLGMLEDDSE